MAQNRHPEDDVISIASSRESFDIDRASIEADRQSLYADTAMQDPSIHSSSTHRPIQSKDQEAGPAYLNRDAEHVVVRDAGPAPPDYAAATAGRSGTYDGYGAVNSNIHPDNNRIFSSTGIFGRNGLFPSNTHNPPEQMSDESPAIYPHAHNENTSLLRDRPTKPSHGHSWRTSLRKCFRPLYIFVVILVLGAIALIIGMQFAPRRDGSGSDDGGGRREGDIKLPDNLEPTHPSQPSNPFVSHSNVERYEFHDVTQFTLVEFMEDWQHVFSGQISGNIWIATAPTKQTAPILVTLSYAVTSPWQFEQVKVRRQSDSLEILFPELKRTGGSGDNAEQRMDLGLVLTLQEGLTLDDLTVSTEHLRIIGNDGHLFDDDKLSVVNTELSAISGGISLPYWKSRQTKLSTISGNIKGRLALYDLLSITSKSGDIEVTVEPKENDGKKQTPGVYTVDTISGKVRTQFITKDIPDRDYQVTIDSKSGTVAGVYVFSSLARITTISGDIDAQIYPVNAAAYRNAALYTTTASGDLDLTFEPSLIDSSSSISSLQSAHRSVSGNIEIVYPQTWEGHLSGTTISGKTRFEGRDLHVDIDSGIGGVLKHFDGGKGSGASEVKLKTTSGGIFVRVGDAA